MSGRWGWCMSRRRCGSEGLCGSGRSGWIRGRRRRRCCRHGKSIDLVIRRVVNPSASRDAGIEAACAGHQFIGAPAAVNHGARVTIVTAQASIGAGYPHDYVTGAIGGSHKGRGPPAGADAPPGGNGGWIGGSDAESGQRAGGGTQNNICA